MVQVEKVTFAEVYPPIYMKVCFPVVELSKSRLLITMFFYVPWIFKKFPLESAWTNLLLFTEV